MVNSLVANIILPPISLLPFIGRDLPEKFAILKAGTNVTSDGYKTLKQARDDGAITLAYGCVSLLPTSFSPIQTHLLIRIYSLFIEQVVTFFGIGLSLYLLAQLYGTMSHDNIIKRTIKCRYCKKWCSEKVRIYI